MTKFLRGVVICLLLAASASLAQNNPGLAVHVKDGQLVDGSGHAIRLLGVSASGTEDACVLENKFSWGHLDKAEAATIASWHINVVRVPLNEDCWLGINGVPEAYSGQKYQNTIRQWVDNLNSYGIIAILDLHWSASGATQATRQWSMADADHSVTFWSQVAKTFASNPAVIFDLFNEPFIGEHGIHPFASDWACWRDGCTTSFRLNHDDPSSAITYATVGMQKLIDTVRAAGATQPLMIGGLNWSGDPCGFMDKDGNNGKCMQIAYWPHDPLNQLILSFHTYYDQNKCTTPACWNAMAQNAASVGAPIITGEMGEKDCSSQYLNAYTNWADQHNVSYLAWSWELNRNTQSCIGKDLKLLADWNGTPSPYSGEASFYKNHLAQLAR